MTDPRVILQARYNSEAGIRFYRLPPMVVTAALPDRTFFRGTPEFTEALQHLDYFSCWDFNSLHGATAIRGWREAVATYSMQIVEHDSGLIEIDFDICNPAGGLFPLIGHGIEVLWPGKTDPFKVAKGLAKRGIKPLQA